MPEVWRSDLRSDNLARCYASASTVFVWLQPPARIRHLNQHGWAVTVKARKYWSCPKCGARNEGRTQRCRGTNYRGDNATPCNAPRPKRRVPTHARTLRDDSYETYERINGELHAAAFDGSWTPGCCGVCGKPPKARHHDRDHDHRTGKPRGLACWHCNRELLRHATLDELRAAVAYLERAAT